MHADPELHPEPLAATAAALRDGTRNLHDHIDATCDAIEARDPAVQSVLPEEGRRVRLHAEADQLLAAFPRAVDRPALFGALVGVKDIFHVDGFVTRAGSTLPPEEFAGPEAEVVRRLRAAGALMLGKTVTTEFAYFEPGPTRNPHNLKHTPGGSSSGSAAALAAGFCDLALGTQTIGSVIRPAAFCGIAGYKPTLHRIPSAGMVYFSPTIDHVGLFTQDAAGMALAASTLLDGWRGLPTGRPLPTFAVPEGAYLRQTEPDALAHFEESVAQMAASGIAIVRVPLLTEIDALNLLHRRMVFAEFARRHAGLYARFAERYRPRTAEIIAIGGAVGDDELAALRANVGRLRGEIEQAMDAAGVGALLTPAAPGPAPAGIHATGDPNLNLPWTHAGMPALTLPAGRAANGLPLGLQLVARFGDDESLLAWAPAIEPLLSSR